MVLDAGRKSRDSFSAAQGFTVGPEPHPHLLSTGLSPTTPLFLPLKQRADWCFRVPGQWVRWLKSGTGPRNLLIRCGVDEAWTWVEKGSGFSQRFIDRKVYLITTISYLTEQMGQTFLSPQSLLPTHRNDWWILEASVHSAGSMSCIKGSWHFVFLVLSLDVLFVRLPCIVVYTCILVTVYDCILCMILYAMYDCLRCVWLCTCAYSMLGMISLCGDLPIHCPWARPATTPGANFAVPVFVH